MKKRKKFSQAGGGGTNGARSGNPTVDSVTNGPTTELTSLSSVFPVWALLLRKIPLKILPHMSSRRS
ncbi:hypothetical protein POVCU2_0004940 [Plasmodium ovale curtisi]|uniref:Uncharacterized protein n=1 Tax=Plasmodium ovale curtisi TaxID=864141 RepID=A0A1A8VNX0_PLAOA|nr:hypothetical protein POVCU2_0004940 [Plasmodium ovale curtisi]SBS81006.1 hypothetical protein POVCU1_004160 [Plasmodium ovale curtisi]